MCLAAKVEPCLIGVRKSTAGYSAPKGNTPQGGIQCRNDSGIFDDPVHSAPVCQFAKLQSYIQSVWI